MIWWACDGNKGGVERALRFPLESDILFAVIFLRQMMVIVGSSSYRYRFREVPGCRLMFVSPFTVPIDD